MEKCFKKFDEKTVEKLIQTVGDALFVLGGKWTLRIIIALYNGNKRFSELRRAVNGISARVLSNELKDLEVNGFLKRVIDSEGFSVTVSYELTEYSFSLEEVVLALSSWGEKHLETIKKSL
ncbi:winged helix-turn-helix transcriptional regulator [Chitinophaga silvisoli]|uniref:Transcriptional regulator n=1 Tax=Chitinophaga silvisoli TaxID=2291814 RepID=A0A3E1NSN7_9BACT|nr:helix-turn-helix domain-containing protein [Chitinophaga silvisoli]RFM30922.1 transcriptional regulator [Chitinophaga silvisoli]